jgi:hypothetical protein
MLTPKFGTMTGKVFLAAPMHGIFMNNDAS